MDDIDHLIPSNISTNKVLIISQTPPKNKHRNKYHYCPLHSELPNQYFDLTIVTDALEHISIEQGHILIGKLKNQYSQQLLIHLLDKQNTTLWSFNQFIGLGFKKETSPTDGAQLYSYNIGDYNHKRIWNNSRFWANPENWNKRF